MTVRNQRGFTLPEMAMAMMIGTIVMLGISVMLVNSNEFLRRGSRQVSLQQDLSLLGEILLTNISRSQQGKHAIYKSYADYVRKREPRKSGTCLMLSFPKGSYVLFYKNEADFMVRYPSSDPEALIQDSLTNLTFTDYGSRIETEIALRQRDRTLNVTLSHAFRN